MVQRQAQTAEAEKLISVQALIPHRHPLERATAATVLMRMHPPPLPFTARGEVAETAAVVAVAAAPELSAEIIMYPASRAYQYRAILVLREREDAEATGAMARLDA